MKHTIKGGDFQSLNVELEPGEEIQAEPGTLMYADPGIAPETSTRGGILKGLSRMVTGERFFITAWKNGATKKQRIAFAAPYPGKIVTVDIGKTKILAQRSAYMAGAGTIGTSIAFTKRLGAGLFGGQGFILQEFNGTGHAWLHAGGNVEAITLKKGQVLRVETGHIVAFEERVAYDVQVVPGLKNIFFGGMGLFWATFTGPGKIWVQTTPIEQLARSIAPFLPAPPSSGVDLGALFENPGSGSPESDRRRKLKQSLMK